MGKQLLQITWLLIDKYDGIRQLIVETIICTNVQPVFIYIYQYIYIYIYILYILYVYYQLTSIIFLNSQEEKTTLVEKITWCLWHKDFP